MISPEYTLFAFELPLQILRLILFQLTLPDHLFNYLFLCQLWQ